METLVFRPENKEQLEALKAFAKALKISFVSNPDGYDPKFVAKIQESRKQFENGDFKVVEIEDLWK
ncbi:DUF2683 family protein [Dyadobacter aurulentus]|uniref:DUF2683 family protein n=1 Tax=Dyadobacter sp. UC 10 TaxID=2605428 RepID=UPI0011F3B8A6|nr:DUF2683 family protein [Dyadobacter sp. UC 10]KAA0989510.1 hypothetical protein FXO21_04710 [Dyadobacter sp. UC 10]